MFFFFSSRRRHTRFDCDWSSDMCSSDLRPLSLIIFAAAALWPNAKADPAGSGPAASFVGLPPCHTAGHMAVVAGAADWESGGEGKRGDLGWGRIILKKNK